MAVTTSAKKILSTVPMGEQGELPEPYWELVEQYRGELINQALSILGDVSDAEDVVQETFCEAIRNGEKLVQARSLGALLRTFNRANALNRLRSRRRDTDKNVRQHRELPRRLVTTGGFSAMNVRESIAKAIERLPEKFRRPVVLRYWEGLTCQEIGDREGLPLGTVKWLLFEATSRMYEEMKTDKADLPVLSEDPMV